MVLGQGPHFPGSSEDSSLQCWLRRTVPVSQLPVTPGGQRLKCGGAGRWSHQQPASARWGSGTARCAWCSAGTDGSSHVPHTGSGPWGAGLGASPVERVGSAPQPHQHPVAELSMTSITMCSQGHDGKPEMLQEGQRLLSTGTAA